MNRSIPALLLQRWWISMSAYVMPVVAALILLACGTGTDSPESAATLPFLDGVSGCWDAILFTQAGNTSYMLEMQWLWVFREDNCVFTIEKWSEQRELGT